MRVTGMPAASGSPLNRLSRVARMFPGIIYRQLERVSIKHDVDGVDER
jgi:hypothetical protein